MAVSFYISPPVWSSFSLQPSSFNMTPAEVRNHQKMIKAWGLLDNPDTKALVAQKIAAGTTDTRVSVGKTDKAIAVAEQGGDVEIVAALRQSRDLAITKGRRIVGTTAILVDKSSSMASAITRGIRVATRLSAHADAVKVYTFDSAAYEIKPRGTGTTLSDWEQAFALVKAVGSTAIGAPLMKMQRDGVVANLVIVVSDMQDGGGSARPTFDDAYLTYTLATGVRPEVVALGVGTVETARIQMWTAKGIPVRYLDWTSEQRLKAEG